MIKTIRVKPLRNRSYKRRNEGTYERKIEIDTNELLLSADLTTNLKQIKKDMGNSPDLIIREFKLGSNPCIQVAAVYIDSLSDKYMVSDFIMRSLMYETSDSVYKTMSSNKSVFDFIKDNSLTIGEIKVIKNWNELLLSLLSGNTLILIDGWPEAISNSTKGGESRAVTEPTTQTVIRGPKESFNESLDTNISLIRRRIKSPNLWLEMMKIGDVTQTDVAILYIKGIAKDDLVEEVKQRLHTIKTDGILESGNIEAFIEDKTFTVFPTIYNTERPDAVAGNLLEGRIAILVNGTPFVLIAPTIFAQFFQVPSDYYDRYDITTFLRVLRYIGFIISLVFPALYIALITFHQGMIPAPLLITLAASREGVPFPAVVEALLMEFSFEILREAGIRMPRAVGQAVSIVGALILGQTAVQAGIVSPAMVIVVAITGISSFSTPSYDLAIAARLVRFSLMLLAAFLGLLGVMLGLITIIAHLSSLRSFGAPYLAPFAPFILADQKDALLRFPLWSLLTRPRFIGTNNRNRTQSPFISNKNRLKDDGNEKS